MTDNYGVQTEHQSDPAGEESFLERHNIPPAFFLLGCLFLIFVLYQLVGGTITYLIVGSKVTRDNVLLHRLFTLGGQLLFIFIPTIAFAYLMSVRLEKVFPWRMPKWGETLFAVLSLLFLQQIFQTYMMLQERIPIPEELNKLLAPLKELMDQTRLIIRKSVESSMRNPRAMDLDAAREDLAENVARFLLQRTLKSPIVIPVIVSI